MRSRKEFFVSQFYFLFFIFTDILKWQVLGANDLTLTIASMFLQTATSGVIKFFGVLDDCEHKAGHGSCRPVNAALFG